MSVKGESKTKRGNEDVGDTVNAFATEVYRLGDDGGLHEDES